MKGIGFLARKGRRVGLVGRVRWRCGAAQELLERLEVPRSKRQVDRREKNETKFSNLEGPSENADRCLCRSAWKMCLVNIVHVVAQWATRIVHLSVGWNRLLELTAQGGVFYVIL